MRSMAQQFIDLLEKRQLLAPEIIEELRRQVAESATRLTPELLAKLLVDNGHLTKFQATKLIAEVKEAASHEAGSSAQPTEGTAGDAAEDEELGFAPEHAGSAPQTAAANSSPVDEVPVAAVFVDDEPVEEKVEGDGEEPVATVEVEAVVAVEPLVVEPAAEATATDGLGGEGVQRPARPVRKTVKDKNPWDSYRILGRAVMLSLLLIALVLLVFYFWRGNADEHLKRADEMYESRSYETAATLYEDFTEKWPTHEKASYAKVRAVLASLRDATELAPDPLIGLERVMELVPGLVGEPGLPEQQSDLAGVLINLAEKFNQRADKTPETAKRKTLMNEMEKLLDLINNPQFVGPTQRGQYAPTLQRIAEDRQRILREINRDEELMRALAEMDKLLDAKETLAAYRVREQLIDTYPLLEANPQVIERVERATEILQESVEPATLALQRADSPPQVGPRDVHVLTHRRGKRTEELQDQVVFVRAGGAAFGIDGVSGGVLWRHFVGRQLQQHPLRIGEGRDADALVYTEADGRLVRLDGRTGAAEWYLALDTTILPPVLEGEEVFVATREGQVLSIDVVSGQMRWMRQLPQAVEVAPGAALGKPYVYVLGEHSNLYVLSRRDGKCVQVLYTGHRAGSIAVRPTILLGLMFLFENISAENGAIRILQTTAEGMGTKDVQLPITVDGNVTVPPTQAGRRLIVHTDLGQILVLDVEPTEEKDKVVVAAKVPKNLIHPQLSWSVFDNNVLWVANTRFSRFNYQVSLGKLDRAWIKNDGDLFLGPPVKFGEAIVHVRQPQGSSAVRVAAVDPETGDAFWEADLAVPIPWVGLADGSVDAIAAAGMLFRWDDEPLVAQAVVDAGQGKPQLNFDHPVELADGLVVLHNTARVNQIAVHPRNRDPELQLLLANLGTAAPACPPVAAGAYVAFGLDNGQFVLIDPSNGSQPFPPYQLPMKPGRTVSWNQPVYDAAGQSLVVASSLQKLVRLSTAGGLRPLNEIDLEDPFDGPLAGSGGRIFAVAATGQGDALEVYDATSLERIGRSALTGSRLAGPFPLSVGGVVQTSAYVLRFDAQGDPLWSLAQLQGALVGAPVELAGGELLVATRDGLLMRVADDAGTIVGVYDLMQGIAAPPLLDGEGTLWVGSREGAVLKVRLEEFEVQQ
ncbi:MAG: serine/threonine protein kinase [Pirellulaceae bacterium]|nr:MAG: serine/threonine protein kinase [Pirellulaceae bacterium]